MIILVMGVCGAGKSTVGRFLARSLGARFIEGDDFHPPENIVKMSNGLALDDDDRHGWLGRLADELEAASRSGEAVVLACSALKQSYRDRLLGNIQDFRVVWLCGDKMILAGRLNARRGHFMPPSLLDSQLALLEPPVDAIVVDIEAALEDVLSAVTGSLARASA